MTQRKKRIWPLWLIAAAVVLLAGIWIAQAILAKSSTETADSSNDLQVKQLDDRPQLLATSDALSRYVDGLNRGDITVVKESHLYLPETINWGSEYVVAIKFTATDADIFTSLTIENIEGKDSYVIDMISPSGSCGYSQIESARVAFIKQASQDTNLPVILRTTKNTVPCNDLQ